jgi:hypothetical protein
MPNREVGEHKNGGSTDRLLGELVAEVRAVKHTAWPFPVISAALAVWIAWANGKFHL